MTYKIMEVLKEKKTYQIIRYKVKNEFKTLNKKWGDKSLTLESEGKGRSWKRCTRKRCTIVQ